MRGAPLEEVTEGVGQCCEWLRVRVPVNARHPGVAFVLAGVELDFQYGRFRFSARFVLSVPRGQCMIPDEPRRAGGLREILALLHRRIELDAMR